MGNPVFERELALAASEILGQKNFDLALLQEVVLRVAVPMACLAPLLNEMRDELAAVEHERWAHWQRYLHSQCSEDPRSEGALVIPSAMVERWERQAATSFDDLGAEEKESDREQVDRYLPLIERKLSACANDWEIYRRPIHASPEAC